MTDEQIIQLIAVKSETANLDYKEGFAWTRDNRDKKYELIRDLMAMTNARDGGRVVLGVRDGDHEFIGVPDAVYTSLDPNNVVQTLHDNSSPKARCAVVKRQIDGKNVIVLDVAEFNDTPTICTNTIWPTGAGKQQPILREGAVYVRTDAAATEEIKSADDMRSLLARAIARKGDQLLESIRQLLFGRPESAGPGDLARFALEAEAARAFITQELGTELEELGSLEVLAHPISYSPERIASLPEVSRLVQASEVALRGWNFPYTDKRGGAGAFAQGFQSTTKRCVEGYRLYQSGLFYCRRVFWEDIQDRKSEEGRRALSFVSAIWAFVEVLIFLTRLYVSIVPETTVRIEIVLHKCKDRELAAFEGSVHLWEGYISHEPVIRQTRDVAVVELRAAHLELAATMVKHVFNVFNWMDPNDEMIKEWQHKLLKRV